MAKKISIIGIPMDFGQLLRGVDMGPAAIRYTGLSYEKAGELDKAVVAFKLASECSSIS